MPNIARRFHLSPPAWLTLSGLLMLAGMGVAATYPGAGTPAAASASVQVSERTALRLDVDAQPRGEHARDARPNARGRFE